MELYFLKIGILVAAFGFIFLQTCSADKKVKKVIIKVPTKIRHVYHQHTQKVHIHKHQKPKPKQPVKVAKLPEENKWKPEWKPDNKPSWKPDWNANKWKPKQHVGRSRRGGKSGGGSNHGWKGRSSAYDQKFKLKEIGSGKWKEERHNDYDEFGGGEESQVQEEHQHHHHYQGGSKGWMGGGGAGGGASWGQDAEVSGEWNHQKRGHYESGEKVKKSKVKKRGHRHNCDYDEHVWGDSTSVQEQWQPQSYSGEPLSSSTKKKSSHRVKKPKNKRPLYEEVFDDYEDSYRKDSVWPDKKEHPSWHQYNTNKRYKGRSKQWSQPIPETSDEYQTLSDPMSTFSGDISFDINSGEFVPSTNPFLRQWEVKSEENQYTPQRTSYDIPIDFGSINSASSLTPAPFHKNNDYSKNYYNSDGLGKNAYDNGPQYKSKKISANSAKLDPSTQFHYNNDPISKHTRNIVQNFANNQSYGQPTNNIHSSIQSPIFYNTITTSSKLYDHSYGKSTTTPAYNNYQAASYIYQSTTPTTSLYSTIEHDSYSSDKSNKEFAIVYQSHVGHHTNGTGPSSSFQELKFGDVKRIRPRQR